jgi:hypothetical protein
MFAEAQLGNKVEEYCLGDAMIKIELSSKIPGGAFRVRNIERMDNECNSPMQGRRI